MSEAAASAAPPAGGSAVAGREGIPLPEVGANLPVKWKDDSVHQGTILQVRHSGGRPSEYYVHYDEYDRRLDEWVAPERIDFTTYKRNLEGQGTPAQQKPGAGAAKPERKVTRNMKRKHDEINHVQKVSCAPRVWLTRSLRRCDMRCRQVQRVLPSARQRVRDVHQGSGPACATPHLAARLLIHTCPAQSYAEMDPTTAALEKEHEKVSALMRRAVTCCGIVCRKGGFPRSGLPCSGPFRVA